MSLRSTSRSLLLTTTQHRSEYRLVLSSQVSALRLCCRGASLLAHHRRSRLTLQHVTCGRRSNWVILLHLLPTITQHPPGCLHVFCSNLSHPQIVTDQQTGQKIQIVTAVKPSAAPKQQFILTTADSSGAGKVILASPDSHSTKQLIFTASDALMPGRIQVIRPQCRSQSSPWLLTGSNKTKINGLPDCDGSGVYGTPVRAGG